MSIALMTEAWKRQDVSSTQKLVLLSLADNANDQGECYPSIAQIVRRTCLSERAVQNAIKSLSDMGLVRSLSRLGTSTIYMLDLSTAPAPDAPPARRAPPQQMHPTPAPDAPPPPQEVHPTPAVRAPKPSLNRQLNRQLTVTESKLPMPDLPDWLDADAWTDWVDHRKAVKAPLTPRAAQLCMTKLSKLRDAGHDPVDVIQQSVITGKWTDLYPIKGDAVIAGRPGMPNLNRQEALEQRNNDIGRRWAEGRQ